MDVQYQRCTYGNGATFTFQGMGLGLRRYGQARDKQIFLDRWVSKWYGAPLSSLHREELRYYLVAYNRLTESIR